MNSSPLKVVCADDNPDLTASWDRLIELQPDMKVVATLRRADDLVATVADNDADLVLLDLIMPGRDPLEATAELHRVHPRTRVVVYSGASDSDCVRQAMDAGAWGYLDKAAEPDAVLDALRRVAKGEVVFSRSPFAPAG